MNDDVCRLRGKTREETLSADSHNAMGTVRPDDPEMVQKSIREMAVTGETRSITYRPKHAGGKYIPVSVFCRVTAGDGNEQFINVYYSMT